MPRCCVVNGCPSKTTIFHGFPQDEKRREGWIEFVRRSGRPDWVPKKNSVICSLHFELDCYSYHPGRDPGFLQLFGLSQRQPRLTRGAQPTIEPGTAAFESALTVDQRCRLAGSGAESDVVRDCAAIDGVNLATEPASAGSPCVPAPGSTASSVSEEPAPFVPRSTRDVQTQCHVQVAMKCDQVDIKLRKVSKCMQTGDITTDQDVASAYRDEFCGMDGNTPQARGKPVNATPVLLYSNVLFTSEAAVSTHNYAVAFPRGSTGHLEKVSLYLMWH
ncbi:hypothetical protein HPB48_009178 [Haemaphysalis longicornis]|uniref:THAP-type domain-containing protein n=1 Tax=Haemaphysalis longicornis TaxID=44386 RepID=A0A9J6GAA2_HAELO|nr:hypothetical protein HPB48_009178 [Haemaphysalis longicornis]